MYLFEPSTSKLDPQRQKMTTMINVKPCSQWSMVRILVSQIQGAGAESSPYTAKSWQTAITPRAHPLMGQTLVEAYTVNAAMESL
ncbi:hypothetical protein Hypma_004605 [Hypsizygus marmoreus]|uniref:Uncharacterized protein n=1 Tax=Hypsizygus marmoreus TaxID=39966 RepID=A0A369K0K6_HYPMA|nr:hypothetical protein Hypma_004605 [Hypsizygus marmoreus]